MLLIMVATNQQAERIVFDAQISSAQSNLVKLRTELNLVAAAAAKTNAILSRINISGALGTVGGAGKGLSGIAGSGAITKEFAAAQNAATMSVNRLTVAMRAGTGTAATYGKALAGAAASARLLSGNNIGRVVGAAKTPIRNAAVESDNLRSGFSGVGLAATGAAVAVLGFATKLTSVIRESSQAASDMQRLNTVFGVLLQSQSKGSALLGDIVSFANTTPMNVPELANSARVLLAYGESSTTVMESIRRLGDIAAGTGQRINEIATLVGKARQAGRLYGDDLNRLNDRGIPLTATLAKNFGLTTMEVRKLVEQGRVGFSALDDAIKDITNEGGIFYGMLEKTSKDFGGVTSNLEDNLRSAKIAFGTPINNALVPIMQETIDMLQQMKPQFQELGAAMAPVVASLATAFKDILAWIAENGTQVVELVKKYGPMVAKTIALATAVKAAQMVYSALGAVIRGVIGTIGGFVSTVNTASMAVTNLGFTLDRLLTKYAAVGIAAGTASKQIAASTVAMNVGTVGGTAASVAGAANIATAAAKKLSTGAKAIAAVSGLFKGALKIGGTLGVMYAGSEIVEGLTTGNAPTSMETGLAYTASAISGIVGLLVPKLAPLLIPASVGMAKLGSWSKKEDERGYMVENYSQAVKRTASNPREIEGLYLQKMTELFRSEETGTRGDRTLAAVQDEVRREVTTQISILDDQIRNNTEINDTQRSMLKRRLEYLKGIGDPTMTRWTEQLLNETKNVAGRAKYDAAIAAEQDAARRANEERRAAERYGQIKDNREKLQEEEIRYAPGMDQRMFWWRRRRTALQELQPDVQELMTGPDTGAYMTGKLGAGFRVKGTEDVKKILDAAGSSSDNLIFASENVLNIQKAYEKILDYEKEEKKLRESKQEWDQQEEDRARSLGLLKQKIYTDQAYAAGLINAEQRKNYEDQLKALDVAKALMDAGMGREEALQLGKESVEAARQAGGQEAIDNATENYKSAATGTLARQGWVDVISLGWRKESPGAFLDPGRYDEQTTGPYQDKESELLEKINSTLEAIQSNTNPDVKKQSVVWG